VSETILTLRQRISAAAQELYLQEGIEGLSMRRVAERVGVSAPAIYRHFRNKDDLLQEIVIEGLRTLEEYLRPALADGSPLDRLVGMTERYLSFALEQPRYFDFAFLVPPPGIEAIPAEIDKRNWVTFKVALEQISACMEQGTFERDDPLQAAITVWAEVHGLVTLFRTGRLAVEPEQFRAIYRGCVRRVLRGMMTDAALAREREGSRGTS
jgi:AcrR family transcriptional regulator